MISWQLLIKIIFKYFKNRLIKLILLFYFPNGREMRDNLIDSIEVQKRVKRTIKKESIY